MGLAGIAESTRILGMGQDRASTRRLAGPFSQVASGVVAVGGSTAPGRRPRPRDPRAGWGEQGVAVRPDGHGLRSRGSGRVTASFAGVAKHYGVAVAICPPRRGNRKGVVEKVNHTAAQRWWRTLADEVTVEAAQASVDRFARVRGDTRIRATADGRSSVAVVAKAEPLSPLPSAPYPMIVTETRTA